jgi:hypothetical protein
MTLSYRSGSHVMPRATLAVAAALCAGLALPSAAQVRSAPPPGAAQGLRAADSGWMSGLFVGSQGLNPDRGRMPDPGFRLPPGAAPGLPPAGAAGGPPPAGGAPGLPLRIGAPVVDPASLAQAGAYLGYRRDNWTLSSGVRQGLGPAAGGTRLDLGASYGFNVAPRHLVTLSGGLTLGASTPAAAYYGAYGTDAFWRAGYRAGEPGAGLRLSWRYSFDRSTAFVDTTLGFDRTHGDADGLQGFDRSTTTFGTTFGYRW